MIYLCPELSWGLAHSACRMGAGTFHSWHWAKCAREPELKWEDQGAYSAESSAPGGKEVESCVREASR